MTKFEKTINNKLKFNFFLFTKLPSAFFSGVRLIKMSKNECSVKVPYKWFSQNPFKSTYFACQAMAAEMATGLLALYACNESDKKISMLVADMKGQYHKKAKETTYFLCNEGKEIFEAVELAQKSDVGSTVTVKSIGTNKAGELISSFEFTWTFKKY